MLKIWSNCLVSSSVTSEKSPNVYKTPQNDLTRKIKKIKPLQLLHKNVVDLVKLLLPQALKRCPNSKNDQSGHTGVVTLELRNPALRHHSNL